MNSPVSPKKYDYLVVGAGPFGAAFSRRVLDAGKTCLVIDKRDHLAGNAFSKRIEGIDVHMYGAHIFHTDSDRIWDFVGRFGEWLPFKNNPRVKIGNRIYSFPINLMTLHQLWGVTTPAEARLKLEEVQAEIPNPKNAEEWLLSQVGREIYELFFKGYTKKQWFKDPKELPASIVSRLPFRLTFNDGYFHTKHQAVPKDGYTALFERMLEGANIELGVDFFSIADKWKRYAKSLIFTGPIDRFFDYELGRLEYRSLKFEFKVLEGDYQGHAVFNHPDESVPYLRSIEHKHFVQHGKKHIGHEDNRNKTVVSYDVPVPPNDAICVKDPQYPIRDAINSALYNKYAEFAKKQNGVIFGGRLGEYKYFDLDQAIGSAINKADKTLGIANRPKFALKASDSKEAV